MPAIGFGTWQIKEGLETKAAVLAALDSGYRLIDTAKIYGNETSVGEAIRQSSVSRDEIFVTTKLWTNDFGYDSAFEAFDASLMRLDMEYVDLYLLHWPNGSSRRDAWRALAEIHRQDKAKAVGVSNFMVEHLEEVLSSGLVPAVNQIEFHPFIYEEQKPVLELCNKHGIVVEAYSPLARARHMQNEVISAIAAAHGKSPAQIMLRWAIQHGTVPIPKSSNPARIKSNLEVFDFELSNSEMEKINNLSSGNSALPF